MRKKLERKASEKFEYLLFHRGLKIKDIRFLLQRPDPEQRSRENIQGVLNKYYRVSKKSYMKIEFGIIC